MPNIPTATAFLSMLNECHPSIQFTMEIADNNEVPFLGMMIERRGCHRTTSIESHHLLYFLLNCPSPCDLRATPLAFPFWRPVHSSFCNGSFLAGDMANPPPAFPHQDGSHWFGSTPFKKIFVGNNIRPKDA